MSFPKNSFDRFGDDLSEVIVSHLSLEDKFRFQCLSKQWSRLVFNRQYDLEVYKLSGDPCRRIKKLKAILNKCPNIRSIELPEYEDEDDSEDVIENCLIMQTIAENYTKLLSLKCQSLVACDQCLDEFFDKFSKTLTNFQIDVFFDPNDGNTGNWFKPIEKCVNLKTLSLQNYNHYIDWSQKLFPRLKRLTISLNEGENVNDFTPFLKNHQNLEVIDFDLSYSGISPEFFDTLSQLKELKSLRIIFYMETGAEILKSLKWVGMKCKKLKHLVIGINGQSSITPFDKLLDQLKYNRFSQLKRLDIFAEFKKKSVLVLRSDSFNCCPQLTHLNIALKNIIITDKFFENISINLPRLQYLDLNNYSGISESMVNELMKPSELRRLQLNGCKDVLDQSFNFVKPLMNKRPKLAIIWGPKKTWEALRNYQI